MSQWLPAPTKGFSQMITCEMACYLRAGSSDARIGFTRWKLLIQEDDDAVELLAFDLDA